jgi:hypothetical protein
MARGTIGTARGRAGQASKRRSDAHLGAQTVIYFGVAGGSLGLAVSLLYARYVRRDPQAVQSGGGFAVFAAFMLLFAVGAAVAGYVSLQAGR